MKKEETDYRPLAVIGLLILAGTFYPSNGVDDRVYKTPTEILTTMLIGILAGIAGYYVLTLSLKNKNSAERTRANKTNSLNPNI